MNWIKSRDNASEYLITSYEPENKHGAHCYKAYGFKETEMILKEKL